MNILVINQFASAPSYNTGAGERHYYISSWLSAKDYDFTIVSGGVNHLFVKNPVTKKLLNEEAIPGGRFIWVKLRKYNSDSFFGRSFSWFEFLIKLFFLPVKNLKPDIIVVSSMSLWSSLYGIWIKKKFKIPFVLEIRDIWPLTPVEIGGFSKYHPFILAFKLLENYSYKKADAIISLMPHFDKYLKPHFRCSKKIYWIPNAIDKSLLEKNNQRTVKNTDMKFNVAYAGALGYANAMECFINAANLLIDHEIEFIIIGDGPERQNLQKLSKDNHKIKFIDKLHKNQVMQILLNADAGFISWRNIKLYNYGVSANKYNDYMLAKLPIISSSNIEDDPVMKANCGFRVASGDEKEIANAIIKLHKMSPEERKALGTNGYNYVIKHNTYEQISLQYEICLNETLCKLLES